MFKLTRKRKSWTANPADPTLVTRWVVTLGRFLKIELTASWGVESYVTLFGHRFERGYDSAWAQRLFDHLEGEWETEQAAYDEDPMGRLSDYV